MNIYFTATKGFEGEMAGVNCRFREGRHYAVDANNIALVSRIEEKIAAGDFAALEQADGHNKVNAQGVADRAARKKASQKTAGMAVHGQVPKPSATVVAGK